MTGRTTRTRLDPEVRRELILDAAERVLVDRIPTEVTFEEIADAADVSRGLVYNYFRDRTALLVAVAKRALDRLDADLAGALVPGADLREQAVALGQAYRHHVRTNAAAWQMLSRSGLLDHPAVQGARAARVDAIAHHWGGTTEARMAAWSITGLYELIGFSALPETLDHDDVVHFVRDVIVPGLDARGVAVSAP